MQYIENQIIVSQKLSCRSKIFLVRNSDDGGAHFYREMCGFIRGCAFYFASGRETRVPGGGRNSNIPGENRV